MWIPLLLTTLAQPQDDLVARQTARACEFYAEMVRGTNDLGLPEESVEFRDAKIIDHRDIVPTSSVFRRFHVGSGGVMFLANGETIRSASFGETLGSLRFAPRWHEAERTVSDYEAMRIARRFYMLAGFPGEIIPFAIRDRQGHAGFDIEIEFAPARYGVPFHRLSAGFIGIDRVTGRVHDFSGPTDPQWLPRPPASFAVEVTRSAAIDVAAREIAARHGGWIAERPGDGSYLCIWSPPASIITGQNQFLTLADREDSARNQGRLVYVAGLEDRTSAVSPKTGGHVRFYGAYVDARTGRVLQIDDISRMGNFGGGEAKTAPAPKWPSGVRAWRLAPARTARWRGPVRGALKSVPSGPFEPKTEVLLQTDGVSFRVGFDPARSLLGAKTSAGTSLARPDTTLLAALRKLLPR